MMPGINGIEAARWIKDRRTDVKILLLSMEINKDLISAGIQSGIDGYLPKEVDNRILIEAIRAVHRGEKYFYESVKRIVFEDFYEGEQKGMKVPVNKSEGAKLTSRETEILCEIASGKGTKEIADQLHISVKTVDSHKSNILSKLRLKTTAELVKYAIKSNLTKM
jgi:DNA-binding NarL/FixJ family response regulator